jgi:hypothetical protein
MKQKLIVAFVLISAIRGNTQTNTFPTSGNVGIGTTSPGTTLQVNGHTSLGDVYDGTSYGLVQIARPSSPSDNKFHLSFIRNGMSVSGMGYMPGSNTIGIWHANNNAGTPAIAITTDQKVGIGASIPAEKLTIGGSDGNIFMGNILFSGYNGITLNGSTNWGDYNFLSKASDNNLYINRPAGAGIFFRRINITQMIIADNGNVGIGPGSNPEAKLDIATSTANDGILLRYNTAGFIRLHSNSMTAGAWNPITRAGDGGVSFGGGTTADAFDFGFVIAPWSNTESGLRVNKDGRVSIGTWKTATGYKLFVEEGIRTRKVKVDQASWADYVFDKNYKLRPIQEVAAFIEQNKHLPDVPSATEVAEDGLDLGNNQATLLKKIEELTLYIIEQDKRLTEHEQQLRQLKRQKGKHK